MKDFRMNFKFRKASSSAIAEIHGTKLKTGKRP